MQTNDATLRDLSSWINNNRGRVENYVADDQQILWSVPSVPRERGHGVAVPSVLVPRVLALVHGTFGHPGVARTSPLIRNKFNWLTLRKAMSEYVRSLGCRRRKWAWSTQLAMLRARLCCNRGSARNGHSGLRTVPRGTLQSSDG